jgi:hypothetical protein
VQRFGFVVAQRLDGDFGAGRRSQQHQREDALAISAPRRVGIPMTQPDISSEVVWAGARARFTGVLINPGGRPSVRATIRSGLVARSLVISGRGRAVIGP